MAAWLTIEHGQGSPSAYQLGPDDRATLGRHRSNTIVVLDELVSLHHALIHREGAAWYITGMRTAINGTRVNGEPIACKTELHSGDEITIGGSRLRFTVGALASPLPHLSGSSFKTVLLADELSDLCGFLARATHETDARRLVRQALEIIRAHTGASAVGFVNLSSNESLPRFISSNAAPGDVPLSRHLTQKAQQEGRTIWLAADGNRRPLDETLAPFNDALCLPLRAAGALHVYKKKGSFNERQRRLCEAVAAYLAGCLDVLAAGRSLETENKPPRFRPDLASELIGTSPAMKRLRKIITRAAAGNSTVLVRGESGVGKELVARALHRQSPRRAGPLVAVNCAAIAASLPEAELFGHCKGAFTGAERDRPGLFQQADEGTLFLDEVGDLPLELQGKLLRVIEGGGFRPVGGTGERQVDVRIFAATNRNLEEQVCKGAFRQDLLFRMQVIQIEVPPLRQHAEDIPELTHYLLDKLNAATRRTLTLTPRALKRLQSYSWPGNIRQLRAVLESAVVMVEGNQIDAEDLLISEVQPPSAASLSLDELETVAIREALQRTKGNVTQAAKLLGVVRDTLASKMKKKGIDRNSR